MFYRGSGIKFIEIKFLIIVKHCCKEKLKYEHECLPRNGKMDYSIKMKFLTKFRKFKRGEEKMDITTVLYSKCQPPKIHCFLGYTYKRRIETNQKGFVYAFKNRDLKLRIIVM